MDENIIKRNELLAQKVIKGLESRNMTGYYAATKEEALKKALGLIPEGASVTMGGAMSAHEIGLVEAVKNGNYNFIDRDKYEDKRAAMLDGYDADVFLSSTNAMTDDPVRRAHGCQYFSYPGYTFAYFREFGLAKYEAPMAYGLDQWVQLTAVIRGASAEFYLGDDPEPVLRVHDLKHGADARGSVGFFSEIGTEAFFRDLEIEFFD